MVVQKIAGRYIAMQRDPIAGGYIVSGATFAHAITALVKVMKRHGATTL